MEIFKCANTTICKADAEEYNNRFDANVQEQYGATIKALYWAVQLDSVTQEITAETAELMLEYMDGKFAYTSRFTTVEATLAQAMEVMLASMEEV